jgi:hypothetical protein
VVLQVLVVKTGPARHVEQIADRTLRVVLQQMPKSLGLAA